MTTHGNIPSVPEFKPAYSVEEVAALLGLHRVTVSGFINRGELRAARLGHRTVRVTHNALMEFLQEKETESMRELQERGAKKKGRGAKA